MIDLDEGNLPVFGNILIITLGIIMDQGRTKTNHFFLVLNLFCVVIIESNYYICGWCSNGKLK